MTTRKKTGLLGISLCFAIAIVAIFCIAGMGMAHTAFADPQPSDGQNMAAESTELSAEGDGSRTFQFISRSWNGRRVVDQTVTMKAYDYAWVTESQLKSGLHHDWWYTRDLDVSCGSRVDVDSGATANLILWDDTTLTLDDGLHVPTGSTLNIYGGVRGTGKLVVGRSKLDTAAIGGNKGESGGTINIYGGTIDVKGGSYTKDGGAGIGGGDEASGCTVNIYGGSVKAQGGPNAAGIGAGEHGSNGGTVNIYGGTVNATGGSDFNDGGAGIGGGDEASGGNITIYGGTVTATGGRDGAGIGGGDDGSGGTITINGGTVNANGNDGAGIGGGQYGHGGTIKITGGTVTATTNVTSAGIGGGQGGNGGNITITGGTVTASGEEGAGIGGGDNGGNGGTITITGGTISATGDDGAGIGGGDGGSSGTIKIGGNAKIIKAQGGTNAAGIGGGYNGACETIEITGGTINAKGGSVSNGGGAGIGGGGDHSGGTITIANANIVAQGGSDGAGIGGGDQGASGNITISGSDANTITATGGGFGAGIGGGQDGDCNSVTINGGTVKATGAADAAGIGGGEKGYGGTVTITDGKVTAIGSPGNKTYEGGAGIGGGESGNGGTVIISGGTVEATGGIDAAGIGGGDQGNGGTVTISGGTVTAQGGECAAGIGGGDADAIDGSRGKGGTVTITGGTVTAKGGKFGAGIGSSEEGCDGGTVIIGTEGSADGPTVTAIGGYKAAGIGGGDAYVSAASNHSKFVTPVGADVTIYSGKVTATGGEDGAGIGGGEGCSNKSTKIYGGEVIATGGKDGSSDGGAGIGSGDDAYGEVGSEDAARVRHTSGGTIEIYGGTVKAEGGPDGAGIGGGDYGSGGTITISGGDVTATGGRYGSGIGGGQGRGAGTVTITGGTIHANGGSETDDEIGGAGIGGGYNDSASAEETTYPDPKQGAGVGQDNISISGTCSVYATGGVSAAGIGGGTQGGPGKVTIGNNTNDTTTCVVEATGGEHGAGIGGGAGKGGVSGEIIINSGTIKATGGSEGGAGIGAGAACEDFEGNPTTVNVTINGGDVTATAGEMDLGSYDSGVAIGTGGRGYDADMESGKPNPTVKKHSVFRGSIKLNGGIVKAYGAKATSIAGEFLEGTLNVIGTSRQDNLKGGTVEFNGAYVYMEPGNIDGVHSQAVRVAPGGIKFTDNEGNHHYYQHVIYTDMDDRQTYNLGRDKLTFREAALTKYVAEDANYNPVIVGPWHDHVVTYSTTKLVTDDDTIVATCNLADCPVPGKAATLTLNKPAHKVYGDEEDPTVTIIDEWEIQGNAQVEYYKANSDGTGIEGSKLSGAPTDPGTYWAQITLGNATAHVTYTIDKAYNPANVESTMSVYQNESASLTSYVYKEGASGAVSYEIDGETLGCTVSADGHFKAGEQIGNVKVKITIAEDNLYKSKVSYINMTVTSLAKQTITAHDVTYTYGDEVTYVEADSSAGGRISYRVKDGGEDIIAVDSSSGSITIKKAGVAYIAVTADAVHGYTSATKDIKVTVNKADNPLEYSEELPVETTYSAYGEMVSLLGAYGGKGKVTYDITSQKKVEGSTFTDVTCFSLNGTKLLIGADTNVGVYELVVTATAAGDDCYNSVAKPVKFTVTIDKAENPLTFVDSQSVAKDYSVDPQTADLIPPYGAENQTVTYAITDQTNFLGMYIDYFKINGTELTITAGTPVGEYTVEVTATTPGNNNYLSGMTYTTVNVTIIGSESAPATITAIDRTYDGTFKPLASADKSTLKGGVMCYALGTDASEVPSFWNWDYDIPTAADAGTYYVWYMAYGDEAHNSSEPACVSTTITKADLSNAKVKFDPFVCTYVGVPWEPTVIVRAGGRELIEDIDFTVSYKNNIKPGMATATLEGIGNYEGTTSGSFVIAQDVNTFSDSITMYRVYNPYSGEHLFTQDKSEYDSLGRIGWKQEGEAWKSPKTGNPVYRLYNSYSGDHHYTTSADEYASLGTIGWTQEGVAFYSGGSREVYRGFNPYEQIGTHHYTIDSNEMRAMVRAGWRDEGVGWYVL